MRPDLASSIPRPLDRLGLNFARRWWWWRGGGGKTLSPVTQNGRSPTLSLFRKTCGIRVLFGLSDYPCGLGCTRRLDEVGLADPCLVHCSPEPVFSWGDVFLPNKCSFFASLSRLAGAVTALLHSSGRFVVRRTVGLVPQVYFPPPDPFFHCLIPPLIQTLGCAGAAAVPAFLPAHSAFLFQHSR